jgi:alanyl-tRNA synthetase
MPNKRKATVRRIHELTGERLLKLLTDETKPMRASMMSSVVQFLKLNQDALQGDPVEDAEDQRAALDREMARLKAQGKTPSAFLLERVERRKTDDLAVPFTE